jgi:hypothetical protein
MTSGMWRLDPIDLQLRLLRLRLTAENRVEVFDLVTSIVTDVMNVVSELETKNKELACRCDMHDLKSLMQSNAKLRATVAEQRTELRKLRNKMSRLNWAKAQKDKQMQAKGSEGPVEKGSTRGLDKKARDKICNDPVLKAYGNKLVKESAAPTKPPVLPVDVGSKALETELFRVNQELDRFPDDKISLERRADLLQLLAGEPTNTRQQLLLDRLCPQQAKDKQIRQLKDEICLLSERIATASFEEVEELTKQRDLVRGKLSKT